MARSTYKGDAEPVVAAISLVATKPNFLAYTEDLKRGPLEATKITRVAPMWYELHKLHRSLTWTQSFMKEALLQVAKAQSPIWGRDLGEDLDTWATAVAKQMRAQARHLAHGIRNGRAWATTCVADKSEEAEQGEAHEETEEGEEEEAQEDPEEDEELDGEVYDSMDDFDAPVFKKPAAVDALIAKRPAAVAVPEHDENQVPEHEKNQVPEHKEVAVPDAFPPFVVLKRPASKKARVDRCFDGEAVYGYDGDSKQPWRKIDGAGKDWGELLPRPKGAADDDFPYAKFPDGATAPITCITYEELEMQEAARLAAPSRAEFLWIGKRDQVKLTVVMKADRSPLLALQEMLQGKGLQLCQCHVRHFGDPGLEA